MAGTDLQAGMKFGTPKSKLEVMTKQADKIGGTVEQRYTDLRDCYCTSIYIQDKNGKQYGSYDLTIFHQNDGKHFATYNDGRREYTTRSADDPSKLKFYEVNAKNGQHAKDTNNNGVIDEQEIYLW